MDKIQNWFELKIFKKFIVVMVLVYLSVKIRMNNKL